MPDPVPHTPRAPVPDPPLYGPFARPLTTPEILVISDAWWQHLAPALELTRAR